MGISNVLAVVVELVVERLNIVLRVALTFPKTVLTSVVRSISKPPPIVADSEPVIWWVDLVLLSVQLLTTADTFRSLP